MSKIHTLDDSILQLSMEILTWDSDWEGSKGVISDHDCHVSHIHVSMEVKVLFLPPALPLPAPRRRKVR